jgi:pimeloyl-ACP methyl ester carboxylesterase
MGRPECNSNRPSELRLACFFAAAAGTFRRQDRCWGGMSFGPSERRDALISPRAIGEFIARIADAFGLDHPHVVGPDVGTSATLFAAALNPGRFRSLTIGTGGAAVPLQLGSPLKEWVEAPNIVPWLKIDGQQVVNVAISTLERYKLSEVARADHLASYAGDRFAQSMRFVRSYPEQRRCRAVAARYRYPVLILNGARDRVVPPVNAEFFHQGLPRSRIELLDAGHFIWKTRPINTRRISQADGQAVMRLSVSGVRYGHEPLAKGIRSSTAIQAEIARLHCWWLKRNPGTGVARSAEWAVTSLR